MATTAPSTGAAATALPVTTSRRNSCRARCSSTTRASCRSSPTPCSSASPASAISPSSSRSFVTETGGHASTSSSCTSPSPTYLVTFVMMPLEIGWHLTVSWNAGDIACRVLMFFRAFGFYLSSFILAAISLDRYFAIAHPLNLNDADKRGKLMLTMAWLFSIVASIPQVGHVTCVRCVRTCVRACACVWVNCSLFDPSVLRSR
ncbi:hypothetical protein NP493_445g03001 [Ridgeia piscesae]|uniref:G-protein coupled receptors family 1 profile domain-containing protein n=1 Tax=Ridgeia piscesae TaxID=27915 RepID=A0AAD9KZ70_RIDPI|nr:hypothetical protein NP493_445g03001 [Ridgeia piscesae]